MLISASDLTAQGITDPGAVLQIPAAQAAVEAWLGVEPGTLEGAGVVTEAFVPRVSARVIPVLRGPITALSSLTVDGTSKLARFRASPRGWALEISADSSFDDLTLYGLQPGQKVLFTYARGWTSQTVPAALKNALCLVALNLSKFQALPQGLRSRKIGDAEVQYDTSDAGSQPISVEAQALLLPYRSPFVAAVL